MPPSDLGVNVAYIDPRVISSLSGFAPGIDTSHGTQMFASDIGLTLHNAENTGLQQALGPGWVGIGTGSHGSRISIELWRMSLLNRVGLPMTILILVFYLHCKCYHRLSLLYTASPGTSIRLI